MVHTEALFREMVAYYAGDPHQVQHFTKVHSFARHIGLGENLDDTTLYTLESAAIVHDIGIKEAVKKHGNGSGKYQEIEGPPIARAMLEQLGYPKDMVDRVCYLVGHHHTYGHIDGIDYQILVEADFLVNIFEGQMSREQIRSLRQDIFKTGTGKWLCDTMFKE